MGIQGKGRQYPNADTLLHGGMGLKAQGSDFGGPLNKVREILKERLDSHRAKEAKDIVFDIRQVAQITSNGPKHHGLGDFQTQFLGLGGEGILKNICARHQIGRVLVLEHLRKKVLQFAFAKRNFAFPQLGVFLKVEADRLGNAVVPGFGANFAAHLLAKPEIMIDGIAAVENDAGEIRQYKAVLAEILGRHSNHFNEGPKINLDIEFGRQFGQGRAFPRFRLGLGNKNAPDFAFGVRGFGHAG